MDDAAAAAGEAASGIGRRARDREVVTTATADGGTRFEPRSVLAAVRFEVDAEDLQAIDEVVGFASQPADRLPRWTLETVRLAAAAALRGRAPRVAHPAAVYPAGAERLNAIDVPVGATANADHHLVGVAAE